MLLALVASFVLGADPYLDEGRAHFNAQRFEQAAAKLSLAVKVPTATDEERRQALDLLARAQLAMGQETHALTTYRELFVRFPYAPEDPNASPKIRAAFNRAKEEVYPKGYCKLTRLPSAEGRLDVEVRDPWSTVAAVRVHTDDVKDRELAPAEHRVTLDLPKQGAQLEAVDAAGQVLASLSITASAAAPQEPVAASGSPAAETSPEPLQVTATAAPAPPARWPRVLLLSLGAGSAITGAIFTASAFRTSSQALTTPVSLDAQVMNRAAHDRAITGYALLGAGVALCCALLWLLQ